MEKPIIEFTVFFISWHTKARDAVQFFNNSSVLFIVSNNSLSVKLIDILDRCYTVFQYLIQLINNLPGKPAISSMKEGALFNQCKDQLSGIDICIRCQDFTLTSVTELPG